MADTERREEMTGRWRRLMARLGGPVASCTRRLAGWRPARLVEVRPWRRSVALLRTAAAFRLRRLARWRPPHIQGIALWLALPVALSPVQAVPLAVLGAAQGVESGVTQELRHGQADLEGGRDLLETAYRTQDPRMAVLAEIRFDSSRQHFQAAIGRVSVLTPELPPWAPAALRDRLDSLQAVVDMGTHLGAGGIGASRLLADGVIGEGGRPSADQLGVALQDLRHELHAAASAGSRIRLDAVPADARATLARARDELVSLVGVVDRVWPYLPALLDLLGFNGPRTYLIEQTNPAELRSGGGFIGTVSIVRTDGGRVTLQHSLPVEQFDYCDAVGCVHPRPLPWQPGYVAPPSELTGYPLPSYSRLTAWSLEDSGFFPDFASNAATAASFCERLLGFRPDGVVAVDYYAVAPLLDLSGPLELPKYGITLTAQNFVDVIVGYDLARSPIHKELIASAADLLLGRLATLPPSTWAKALTVLGTQLARRHLQVHLEPAAAAEAARRLGLSDAFAPAGGADFLLETEDNYGGSKANYFLDRRYHLTLTRIGATLHHRLVVDLTDNAPPDQRYIGPHYFSYVRLYVPAGAEHLMVRSAPSTEYPPIQPPGRRSQEPPSGAQLTGGWVFVDVGPDLSGRYQVTFEYDTTWAPGAGGEQVLYWQKQPGTVADPILVTWEANGRELSVVGDLATDRLVRLGDDGLAIADAAPAS